MDNREAFNKWLKTAMIVHCEDSYHAAFEAWTACERVMKATQEVKPLDFEEWKATVEQEDKLQFDRPIERPVGIWLQLYESYLRKLKEASS